MSRIGKLPIKVPKNVNITLNEQTRLKLKVHMENYHN